MLKRSWERSWAGKVGKSFFLRRSVGGTVKKTSSFRLTTLKLNIRIKFAYIFLPIMQRTFCIACATMYLIFSCANLLPHPSTRSLPLTGTRRRPRPPATTPFTRRRSRNWAPLPIWTKSPKGKKRQKATRKSNSSHLRIIWKTHRAKTRWEAKRVFFPYYDAMTNGLTHYVSFRRFQIPPPPRLEAT